VTMKNPPHPAGVVLRQWIDPQGLTIADAAAAHGGDAQHALGARQWEARHIPGNDGETLQSVCRLGSTLACATGPVRSSPASPGPSVPQAIGNCLNIPLHCLRLSRKESVAAC
jgi:hypothetical protein